MATFTGSAMVESLAAAGANGSPGAKEKKILGFGGILGASLTSLKKVVMGGSARKHTKSMGETYQEDDELSLGSLVDDLGTLGLDDRKAPTVELAFSSRKALLASGPATLISLPSTPEDKPAVAAKQQLSTSDHQLHQLLASATPTPAHAAPQSKHTSSPQTALAQPQPQHTSRPTAHSTPTLAPLSWSHFERVRAIGSGSYGCVTLCRHKSSGQPCVIKAVSKAYAFAKKEQQHTLNERDVLAAITRTDCPFTTKVYGYFQDDDHLYYVLEYVPGGELFTYMVEYDTFDDAGAKFFVAQVALAFEHMHSLGMVFRDCKPENMLVDERGYVKICDFGFARFIPRGSYAYTMCGTPEYIAPEVLRGKGHGLAVDLWALGIFAYELLIGRTPFEGGNSRATHVNILNGSVRFPDYVTADARDFITRLLSRDETERLGCGREGFSAVFSHPWLASVDLDKLRRRELPSPIPVKVSGLFDSRNFERVPSEENRAAGFAPLTDEQQQLFAGFDDVAREFPPAPAMAYAVNCDVFG